MEDFVYDLSVLLVSVAFLSYLAVLFKQPIIIAYIVCGIVIGPWGFGLVQNIEFIEGISHLGITLLLFLAGLCLHPRKLLMLLRKTTFVTILNCLVSFVVTFVIAILIGFPQVESFCIALALMFSSTILTVKLLPTIDLHHERIGAVCIGVLILQDLLAVAVLAFIRCLDSPDGALFSFSVLSLKLVVFISTLVVFETYVLRKVMAYIERMHELLFLLGLAWCFGIATISNHMGLFYETGAFFAGVALARHPVSRFIAEELKPLRDFFLVLFFFTLGANLDFFIMKHVAVPALILTAVLVILKPWIFQRAFIWSGETKKFSTEVGFRLGQLSEFSLLVAILAFEVGQIGAQAAQFIQLVTIFSFVVSSYLVVYKYPTPIGTSEHLIRD